MNYPELWRTALKMKWVIGLSEDMNNRVQIYHRVNFYREHILDYFKELYLDHILVMVLRYIFRHNTNVVKISHRIWWKTVLSMICYPWIKNQSLRLVLTDSPINCIYNTRNLLRENFNSLYRLLSFANKCKTKTLERNFWIKSTAARSWKQSHSI